MVEQQRVLHALVADADMLDAYAVNEVLVEAGWTCQIVDGAQQAYDLMRRMRYDLVVVSVQLRETDALVFLNAVRTELEFSSLPIIVLGEEDEFEERDALEFGANRYIPKTFVQDDPQGFLNIVQEVILGN